VKVPTGPLIAMSSVGFMAILALPARLGEFVRPGLLRTRGYCSASAALGTVAVERIVDGLAISLVVFFNFFALRGPNAPGWMMPTAYTALGVFAACLVFLVFAMRRPGPTVRFCLKMSLLPRFAPRIAKVIEKKALEVISGFGVLKDPKNLGVFLLWTIVYWGANGLGVLVLARAFGLDLGLVGAFATMGLLGVGISLPNSPGMVGQFQWFTLVGMSLYLNFKPDDPPTMAYLFANAQYLLQVAWYVGMGMLALATPWVSFHDLWASRKAPEPEAKPASEATAGGSPSTERARTPPIGQKLATSAVGGDHDADASTGP